jgi:8-oxo-dGTP pyrophosphatase MutT (NUDIX family)
MHHRLVSQPSLMARDRDAEFLEQPIENHILSPVEAASLILMRETPGSAPEILIVQRSTAMVFAAGAYVFPGGRVDPEDREAGAVMMPLLDPADAAARVAALRETLEETGIAVPDEADRLVPFARWLPPPTEKVKRRFDTRFYLARAVPAEALLEPVADGTETSHAFWATANEVLERCLKGDGRAIFPTRRMLERLAQFDTFEEARAQAERLPQQIISPWIEVHADGKRLCIPDNAGYPITNELLETAFRY